MRFVPVNCIREGSMLAKTLYGMNGESLLKAGTELSGAYIKRIISLGMQGVYIEDRLSEDLEIADAISDELRIKATKGVKSAFLQAASDNNKNSSKNAQIIMETAGQIVDELLSQSNVIMNIVDIRVYDDYTYYHCMNVTVLSVLLGMSMGFSREKLVKLAYASLMHDVGKVFIDPMIINKKGRLTDQEYQLVQKHPLDGYNYLRTQYGMSELSARGVLEHHERYDGTGYPNGRVGQEITEMGRIIAVADVYDALVSDRPYRKGLFATEAMEYLMGGSGRLFDPLMVHMFARKVALFPVGTCVLLSNGEVGLVMENFEGYAQRPLLRVFMKDDANIEPYMLDMCHDYGTFGITIVATVPI